MLNEKYLCNLSCTPINFLRLTYKCYFYAPKLSKFKAKIFMNFSNDLRQQLIAFRKDLHRHPEISKNEHARAQKILNFITPFHPDKIILLYDLSLERNN